GAAPCTASPCSGRALGSNPAATPPRSALLASAPGSAAAPASAPLASHRSSSCLRHAAQCRRQSISWGTRCPSNALQRNVRLRQTECCRPEYLQSPCRAHDLRDADADYLDPLTVF